MKTIKSQANSLIREGVIMRNGRDMKRRLITILFLTVFTVGVTVTFAKSEDIIVNGKSKSQSLGSNRADSNIYPKNESGLTYGGDVYGEDHLDPDLILAYGTNGELGYVYSRDLNPSNPKTPEEALNNQREKDGQMLIPLYDKEGVEVIGQFLLGDGKNQ